MKVENIVIRQMKKKEVAVTIKEKENDHIEKRTKIRRKSKEEIYIKKVLSTEYTKMRR